MLLFVFIGTIFFFTAAVLFFVDQYYKKFGVAHQGVVIAIERYINTTYSKNSQTTTTLYRPIYEFTHQEKKIWIAGTGEGSLRKNIGDRATILSLPKLGPQYCTPRDNSNTAMTVVFSAIGFCCMIITWITQPESLLFALPLVLNLIFVAVVYQLQKSRNLADIFPKWFFRQAHIETPQTLQGREIYWSSNEMSEMLAKHKKYGLYVSAFFLGLSLVISYLSYQALEEEHKITLLNLLRGATERPLFAILANSPEIMFSLTMFFVSFVLLIMVFVQLKSQSSSEVYRGSPRRRGP